MLNFYGNPYSPYVTKVHYFLEEAGIPYQYHQLMPHQASDRALLDSVNPFGKVPSIELNGFHLGESNAILRYLAARYETYQLYPVNLEDRAQVDMLFEFVQNHLAVPFARLAWNLYWGPKYGMGAADPKVVSEAQADLARLLPRLESWLIGRHFLAGAQLTIADIVLIPFASQHHICQVALADFPNFKSWTERTMQRPAWKKVAAELETRAAR